MGGRKRANLDLKNGVFIVGEGLTEQYYFEHLKQIKKYHWKVRPRLFGQTDISKIEKIVKKLLLGGATAICVFDADVSKRNKIENERLISFKNRYKKSKNVIICDSLPSIEFWFLLHFKKTNKHFTNASALEKELKIYLKDYSKTKKYLQNSKWVIELVEKLDFAITNAKTINSNEGQSYTNMFKAFKR